MWTIRVEGGPRRVNHAAVSIGNKVYSFGGYCSGEVLENESPIDVHVLNTETYRWQCIKLADQGYDPHILSDDDVAVMDTKDEDTAASYPYQRYGHTVVEYNERAYLWGGRNDEFGASSLLHEFNPWTQTWRLVKTCGRVPPARDGHSAVVVGDKMYLFGGFEEEAQRFSQETFVFDFKTSTWMEMRTNVGFMLVEMNTAVALEQSQSLIFGRPPIWRDFHTAAAIGTKMYVFGGRSDQMGQYHSTRDVYCEHMKVLDLVTCEWSEPVVTGDKPGGRRSHSAWTHAGKMYIFGGYLGINNIHYNDMYCLDPSTNVWTKVQCTGLVSAPSPRRRQCTVVVKNRVFLFGGTMPVPGSQGLADLADLFVLDYAPSLLHIAAQNVIALRYDEKYAHEIPKDLRRALHFFTTPNVISTPPVARNEVAG